MQKVRFEFREFGKSLSPSRLTFGGEQTCNSSEIFQAPIATQIHSANTRIKLSQFRVKPPRKS